MNIEETQQFLDDVLRGMVALRQYKGEYNDQNRHRAIRSVKADAIPETDGDE